MKYIAHFGSHMHIYMHNMYGHLCYGMLLYIYAYIYTCVYVHSARVGTLYNIYGYVCEYVYVHIFTHLCRHTVRVLVHIFIHVFRVPLCMCACILMESRCVRYLCLAVWGGFWWVGSLKLQVSFAKEPYKRDDIMQNRPVILRSLLIVATPYVSLCVCVCCSIGLCLCVSVLHMYQKKMKTSVVHNSSPCTLVHSCRCRWVGGWVWWVGQVSLYQGGCGWLDVGGWIWGWVSVGGWAGWALALVRGCSSGQTNNTLGGWCSATHWKKVQHTETHCNTL